MQELPVHGSEIRAGLGKSMAVIAAGVLGVCVAFVLFECLYGCRAIDHGVGKEPAAAHSSGDAMPTSGLQDILGERWIPVEVRASRYGLGDEPLRLAVATEPMDFDIVRQIYERNNLKSKVHGTIESWTWFELIDFPVSEESLVIYLPETIPVTLRWFSGMMGMTVIYAKTVKELAEQGMTVLEIGSHSGTVSR